MKRRFLLLMPIVAAVALVLILLPRFASSDATECLTAGIPAPAFDASRTPSELDYTPEIEFSLRLFSQGLSKEQRNFCCSPISMLLPLAALETGARGETLEEMAELLGRKPSETLAAADSIMARLAQKNKNTTEFIVGNSFWFAPIFDANASFLSTIKSHFDADAFRLPLDQKAVDSMNRWVKDRTKGRITDQISGDLMPQDDGMTEFYLINTVYIDAQWETPFDKSGTHTESFNTQSGKKADIPFMGTGTKGNFFSLIQTGEADGVVLPYRDGNLAFVALRPKNGNVSNFASSLTTKTFCDYVRSAKRTSCVLRMPKIEERMNHMWRDDLGDLDWRRCLAIAAICPGLGKLTHILLRWDKSIYIRVDEKGAKAAAGTVFKGLAKSSESSPPIFSLDSPFVYAIIDSDTCLPLFLGVFTGE